MLIALAYKLLLTCVLSSDNF